MKTLKIKTALIILILLFGKTALYATDYHVGPDQNYANINDVPWEQVAAGDRVFIHWRAEADGGAYKEKWVVNVAGTETEPFIVSGVVGPNGERPVIDGNGAVTRTELSYWGENRSVIKIGGSGIPANDVPSYIVIENLEIRSAHPDYSFTDDNGNPGTYTTSAASIFIETGNNITIRNCVIHDSSNGIFSAWESTDVLIEKNYIYGNGIENSNYQHNTYTESTNIIYQYNRFGALRNGARGNNLKDRSAGLVVRYNWIEGGNRLLDLVESDNEVLYNNPVYRKTFVYGNILIEEDGGNNQVIHYGGDNGDETIYRKGKLYFYNNTLYSVRAGTTTLIRLSSNDESTDIRNNILYVTASGSNFAILDDTGIAQLKNNLIKPGWVNSHSGSISGSIEEENTFDGSNPGFVDADTYDFHLQKNSPAINKGTSLSDDVLPEHDIVLEYKMHQDSAKRVIVGVLDIGAFEYEGNVITGMQNKKDLMHNTEIRLYPNPVDDYLVINSGNTRISRAYVYTLNGQMLLSFDGIDGNQMNVSSLKQGSYIIKCDTNTGKIVFKFFKK